MHCELLNSIVHDSSLGSFLVLIAVITDVSWVILHSGMYNNQKIHQVLKPNYALLMEFNTNTPIRIFQISKSGPHLLTRINNYASKLIST